MILTRDEINDRWQDQLGDRTDREEDLTPMERVNWFDCLIGYSPLHTLDRWAAWFIAWNAASRVCWHESANCTYFDQVVHAAFLTHGNQRGIGRYAEGRVTHREPGVHTLNFFFDHTGTIYFINSPWWNPGRSNTNETWIYRYDQYEGNRFWGRQF